MNCFSVSLFCISSISLVRGIDLFSTIALWESTHICDSLVLKIKQIFLNCDISAEFLKKAGENKSTLPIILKITIDCRRIGFLKMPYFNKTLYFFVVLLLITSAGCSVLPQRRFKPTLHNPRMQLREVAVVPFLNRSGNDHADGYEVAQLYANQLQRVSGFHVTPVETVKQAMLDAKLTRFESVDDIRALGEFLNVDVVVMGAINQYSSYQPPNITLEVEWYATNPYFHPIVAGHGLPWGTPAEKEIPDRVILQVEQDLARAQLATQTPDPKALSLQKIDTESMSEQLAPSQFPSGQSPLQQMPNAATPHFQSGYDNFNSQNAYPDSGAASGMTVPQLNMPNAAYLPPSLSPNFTLPQNGGNTVLPTDNGTGRQVVTAYYPQFETENGSYAEYYNDEENSNPETQEYLQKQREAMQEMALRARGVPSRPKKLSTPETTRQYDPYEAPSRLPSQRIAGSVAATDRSNVAQNSSQTYAEQPLPVVMGHVPAVPDYLAVMPGTPVGQGLIAGEPVAFPGLPANWPDPRGLIPDGPQATLPDDLTMSYEPVMRHVATYNGNDVDFTRRLADYESLFVDDRRIGGWQGILRRRTDFISACCCMHIWEMLSCRGGAGKAERVCTQEKFWMNP